MKCREKMLFAGCTAWKKDKDRRKGKGRRVCLEEEFSQFLAALVVLPRTTLTIFLSDYPGAIHLIIHNRTLTVLILLLWKTVFSRWRLATCTDLQSLASSWQAGRSSSLWDQAVGD